MQDSIESSRGGRWLLLIHQLPPKPDYLRVKVRRRLQRLRAVPLRPSVYALPDEEEFREDFQWLLGEIRSEGGQGLLCRCEFLDGVTEEELRAMFERTLPAANRPEPLPQAERVAPGRTWVTRQGVHVDRMASAWLIRRFIDPTARFRFVPARGYRPEPGELRFDMYQAEYTHEGDACTFQVLARRFGLADPGLVRLGEIIRDIDCKDAAHDHPETAGVAALVDGIAAAEPDDTARLERSGPLFDGLLRAFAAR